MEKKISHCGLLCTDCDAYKATVNNDQLLRKKIAVQWSEMYQAEMKEEDIHCLGCKSDTHIAYCNICKVRTCSTGKTFDNCSQCDSFGCDNLQEIFSHAPEAKERLLKLRE